MQDSKAPVLEVGIYDLSPAEMVELAELSPGALSLVYITQHD